VLENNDVNNQQDVTNLVQCTDTAGDRSAVSVHCTKSCIYSQKLLLRIGEFVARNM